jgi:hypothetical protein
MPCSAVWIEADVEIRTVVPPGLHLRRRANSILVKADVLANRDLVLRVCAGRLRASGKAGTPDSRSAEKKTAIGVNGYCNSDLSRRMSPRFLEALQQVKDPLGSCVYRRGLYPDASSSRA